MRLRLTIPIAVAALIALPGCSRPRPAPARPALFVVRDADTSIWLFGTIHVLPNNLDWRTPAIDRAVAQADLLVTELPAIDRAQAGAAYARFARGHNLPPVEQRLPPGQRAAFHQAIAAAGLTKAALDPLDDWAVAVAIGQAQAAAQGADVEHGVEEALARRFADRPRIGLETLNGQLALLDGLPPADQRRMLTDAFARPDGFRQTLSAWSRGDIGALAVIDDRLFAGSAAFERALLTGRNERWSQWIAARMAKPGKVFVAVGAGHLAGPKSVVAMLRARGFRVARVQ